MLGLLLTWLALLLLNELLWMWRHLLNVLDLLCRVRGRRSGRLHLGLACAEHGTVRRLTRLTNHAAVLGVAPAHHRRPVHHLTLSHL